MEAALIPGLDTASAELGISTLALTLFFAAITIWSLAWKGVGLWHAARNHQTHWFIAMLILNTIGILEIIYLLWFRADKQAGRTPSLFNTPMPGDEPAPSDSPATA